MEFGEASSGTGGPRPARGGGGGGGGFRARGGHGWIVVVGVQVGEGSTLRGRIHIYLTEAVSPVRGF